MNTLLVSDFQLTDSPVDEYRWGIFDWLLDVIEDDSNINQLIILGDLTEKKDEHSSKLVNRLIENFKELLEVVENIYILKGNHDYDKDPKAAFFRFVDGFAGQKDSSRLTFIETPQICDGGLFLPHTRNPEQDWETVNFEKSETIFMHQTVSGAKYSGNIVVKENSVASLLPSDCNIYSGDIHIPQTVRNITYVGAPYSVDFGDHYDGRVLIIDDLGEIVEELKPNFLKKWSVKIETVKELEEKAEEWRQGDRVKIQLLLHPRDLSTSYQIKKEIISLCKEKEVSLFGVSTGVIKEENKNGRVRIINKLKTGKVSDKTIIQKFVSKERKGDDYLEMGIDILGRK